MPKKVSSIQRPETLVSSPTTTLSIRAMQPAARRMATDQRWFVKVRSPGCAPLWSSALRGRAGQVQQNTGWPAEGSFRDLVERGKLAK
jgi:hypothetical protein